MSEMFLSGASMIQKYPVEKVIGDTFSEYIPTIINRTLLEAKQIESIFKYHTPGLIKGTVVDVGCGYGRMLPILGEFFVGVFGAERDEDLRDFAKKLNPEVSIGDFDLSRFETESLDCVFTYTVLQHLNEIQFPECLDQIKRILKPKGFLISCEHGFHSSQFKMKFVYSEPRVKEATYEKLSSGTVFVFTRE